MDIVQGMSCAEHGRDAVREAVAGWLTPPDIPFALCSAIQGSTDVVQALTERFPNAVVAGSTTSGEYLDGQRYHNSVVVTGLCNSGIEWATGRVTDLEAITGQRADAPISGLFHDPGTPSDDVDPEDFFTMSSMDGKCSNEGTICALIDGALCSVHLAGGSAGDDATCPQAQVPHADGASGDAVILAIVG
jgi:hypothetical protein